jgi:nucleotide-binding universal stress UspA family protein
VAIAPNGYARERSDLVSVGSAFDGSAESRAALDWAGNLARSIDAELHLLGVHVALPPVTLPDATGVPVTSVNRKLRDELRHDLTEAEASVRDRDVKVTKALVDGSAASEIAKASERLDLLVVGSRGYGPLGAVMLGSVSNALVRTARCPLVVVPRSSGRDKSGAG